MKKRIKIVFFSLLAVLLLGLISCTQDRPPVPTDTGGGGQSGESLSGPEGTDEPVPEIPEGAVPLSSYLVTYPEASASYVADWAKSTSDAIKAKLGSSKGSKTDWYREESDYDPSSPEILIGNTNRPESAEVLATLAYNEYSVLQKGNKIVIQSHSLSGIDQAISKLYDAIILAKECADGYLLFRETGLGVFSMNWCGDVPAFEGGSFKCSVEGNLNGYQLVYTDTTAAQLEAYEKKLLANGYTVMQSGSAGENRTGSYVNQAAGLRVFVSYTAFNGITGIVVEPYTEYELINGTPGELPVQVIAGSCNDRIYFIRLSDGRIIVVDGDNVNGTQTETFMQDLITVNGSEENIRIAAWIISHPHGDHYKMIEAVGKTYGDTLTVEQVIYNIPTDTMYKLSPENAAASHSALRIFAAYFASQPQLITPHTGQIFSYSGTTFEILFTHEDIYPEMFGNANQTSLVVRMTAGNESVIWTHDMETQASIYLVKKYRELLKCDAVMVGHHGWNGGGILEFYQYCAPSILIWNNCYETWKQSVDNGTLGQEVLSIYRLAGVTRHIWCMSASGELDILTFPIHHAE